jgi:hypothetical protein
VIKHALVFGVVALTLSACNGPDEELISDKTDATVDLTSVPPTVDPERPAPLDIGGEDLPWDTSDTEVDDTEVDDTDAPDTDTDAPDTDTVDTETVDTDTDAPDTDTDTV